jgi:DNA-binding MarR family transcriptional regulator
MTLPSMSGMIDGLVNRHLAIRQTHPTDRRRMILTLTNQGQTTLKTARAGTQSHLAGLFGHLSQSDCATVTKAMRILRPLFSEVA